MSLYFIFTIDGDWNKYFYPKLSEAERRPDKKAFLALVGHETRVASSVNGKFLHFIHSSPIVPDFFLQPEFITIWKNIETNGGGVGVHCHNEHLYHDCDHSGEEIEKV